MPPKPFSLVYDHRVRLDECIFGADSEKRKKKKPKKPHARGA